MIHPGRAILKSWVELLDGQIFYDGSEVKGYRTDVDVNESGHYYVLRLEGGSNNNNNRFFVNNVVVILDIVTRFPTRINDVVVFEIASEIDRRIFPDPQHHGLPEQSGFQIVNVTRQNETILPEDDGSTTKINRLVARYVHRIRQLDES